MNCNQNTFLLQIRHTHVQDGEAGGITQQIGATMVPVDAIREQTKMIKDVSFKWRLQCSFPTDTTSKPHQNDVVWMRSRLLSTFRGVLGKIALVCVVFK